MALLRSRAPRQIARRKIDLLVYCSDDAVRVFTALNMGKEGGIFPRFEKVLEQGRDARATGTERSCLTYSTWFSSASSSMGSMFSRARIQLRTVGSFGSEALWKE